MRYDSIDKINLSTIPIYNDRKIYVLYDYSDAANNIDSFATALSLPVIVCQC